MYCLTYTRICPRRMPALTLLCDCREKDPKSPSSRSLLAASRQLSVREVKEKGKRGRGRGEGVDRSEAHTASVQVARSLLTFFLVTKRVLLPRQGGGAFHETGLLATLEE